MPSVAGLQSLVVIKFERSVGRQLAARSVAAEFSERAYAPLRLRRLVYTPSSTRACSVRVGFEDFIT